MGARNIGPTQQQRCRRQPAWPGLLDAAEGDTRGVRRGIEGVVAKRACDSVMIRAEVNIQGSLRQRQAAGGHLLLRVSWCHHAHAAVGPARMKLQALLAGPGPPIGWSIRCRLTINVNVLRLQAPSLEEATEGPEQLLAADEQDSGGGATGGPVSDMDVICCFNSPALTKSVASAAACISALSALMRAACASAAMNRTSQSIQVLASTVGVAAAAATATLEVSMVRPLRAPMPSSGNGAETTPCLCNVASEAVARGCGREGVATKTKPHVHVEVKRPNATAREHTGLGLWRRIVRSCSAAAMHCMAADRAHLSLCQT
eukprot:CAMPEP_0115394250 /NCGR_PEP_ID=MMETSP0271-20121206/12170_1 /TAXON_ID=71861 /ORGANISM="Scrippsiella trochoidea, Strain CCMP3099" /LENGTH=316 /DNA_ID=CAMNT_0002817917 /DNA_START=141 /DNA_END=1088 /DNA_ORIENTATION=-